MANTTRTCKQMNQIQTARGIETETRTERQRPMYEQERTMKRGGARKRERRVRQREESR